MEALSFDVGLRNLGAAVVRVVDGFQLPAEFLKYASEDETADDFKLRAMLHFTKNAWVIRCAKLIDVSEYLGRETRVKNVKTLPLMSKAKAIHATLESLEKDWFPESAPDLLAVEIQHGANARMAGVSLTIPVFFMRSMECTEFRGVVGGQKLKLCDVVGVRVGDGLTFLKLLIEERKALKASKRKTPVRKPKPQTSTLLNMVRKAAPVEEPDSSEDETDDDDAQPDQKKAWFNPRAKMWAKKGKKLTSSGLSTDDKYPDNKGRAMAAMRLLVAERTLSSCPDVLESTKDPNVSDAILQGVWVLWEHYCPRAPTRRKRKDSVTEARPKSAKKKQTPAAPSIHIP